MHLFLCFPLFNRLLFDYSLCDFLVRCTLGGVVYVLTEVVGGAQGGEDAGEELQAHLYLRTVPVSAETRRTSMNSHREAVIGQSLSHEGGD